MFSDRRLLLLPIAAAHFSAFLAIQSARAVVPPAPEMALSIYAAAEAAAPPVAAAPAFNLVSVETDVAPPAIDPPLLEQAAVGPEGVASGGDGCDLTAIVQDTLRSDPVVRAALASLPQADRSVANALMLWDGRWIDGTSTQAAGALAQVRAAVAAVVREASAACRDAPQSGPRLIAIAGAPDTVLALGSGRWRWGDLASP